MRQKQFNIFWREMKITNSKPLPIIFFTDLSLPSSFKHIERYFDPCWFLPSILLKYDFSNPPTPSSLATKQPFGAQGQPCTVLLSFAITLREYPKTTTACSHSALVRYLSLVVHPGPLSSSSYSPLAKITLYYNSKVPYVKGRKNSLFV